MFRPCVVSLVLLSFSLLHAEERNALQISQEIQAKHMPFGAILDPIYQWPDTDELIGYSRCGDSALMTGHYLAAEAFRYHVTKDPEALANAWRALTGLRTLVYVTGNNLLARCAVPVESPFAEGILSEEQSNGAHTGQVDLQGYFWIGNTSRDQYIGAFFGLVTAWDEIADPAMNATIADLVWKMLDFLQLHDWNVVMPDGSSSTTFVLRPDQKLGLLQVGRHILPDRFGSDYSSFATFNFELVPAPILVDVSDESSSYFKFNLDSITLYNLVRLENNPTRRSVYQKAYDILRNTTDGHQNAHFNMLDRVLSGPNAARDAETARLLKAWLLRPHRDVYVDLTGRFPACGNNVSCVVIPVELRPTTDFLWQRSPFQLMGGGSGRIESAGIDYILPYWMARAYGVLGPDGAVDPGRVRRRQ